MTTPMQTSDASDGKREVKTHQATDEYLNPNSVVEGYRPYLPGTDKQANTLWLRKKLLTDEDYRHNVVSSMFEEVTDEEKLAYYRENPEAHQEDFKKVDNAIYNKVVAEVYTGEDTSSAIQKRKNQLEQYDFNDLSKTKDISHYKDLITDNPDTFEPFGLLNEDGELDLSDDGLRLKLATDEELRSLAIGKEYEEFEETLNTMNNVGIDKDNVNAMAEAFTIFDKFGSETLTQYMNYIQHYDPTKSMEEQSQQAVAAVEHLQAARQNGKDIHGHIDDFFGGEDSETGQFELELSKTSREMLEDVERDANPFSYLVKYSGEDELSSLTNFIETVKQDGKIKGVAYNWSEGKENTLVGNLIGTFDFSKYGDKTYFDSDVEEVAFEMLNGLEDHKSRYAIYDIVDMADEGERFNWQDIMRQVIVNAKPHHDESKPDAEKYVINIEEADLATRMAIRALEISNLGSMVKQIDSERVTIEPDYHRRLQSHPSTRALRLSNIEPVIEKDENGNIIGVTEAPADGAWNWLGRRLDNISVFAQGFGKMAAQQVGDVAVKPFYDLAAQYLNSDYAQRLSDSYTDTFSEWYEAEIHDDTGMQKWSAMAGTLFSYLYGTAKIGEGAISGLARSKYIKNLSQVKTAQTAKDALTFLKPKTGTKLANFIQTAAKNNSRFTRGARKGANTFAKIEIGELVRQPVTPAELSIFQVGTFSDEMGWTENAEDITKAYNRSNRYTQIGVDVIANGVLAQAFDQIWALSRFGGNKAGFLFGKKRGRGIKWDGDGYELLPKEQYNFKTGYSPDIRRWWSNTMDEAALRPVGSIAESARNWTAGRGLKFVPENMETQADMVKSFTENAETFMGDLYDTVYNSLSEYDNAFAGRLRDQADLEQATKKIIDESFEYMGSQFSDILRESGQDELVFNFTKLLRESEPQQSFIKGVDDAGNPKTVLDKEQAQSLVDSNHNATMIEMGDGYAVLRTDPLHWANKLADSIETNYKKSNFSNALKDYAKSLDIDPMATGKAAKQRLAKLQTEFEGIYGQKVKLEDGTEVTVIGKDKDELIVHSLVGKTQKIKQADVEDQFENTSVVDDVVEEPKARTGEESEEAQTEIEAISGQMSDLIRRSNKAKEAGEHDEASILLNEWKELKKQRDQLENQTGKQPDQATKAKELEEVVEDAKQTAKKDTPETAVERQRKALEAENKAIEKLRKKSQTQTKGLDKDETFQKYGVSDTFFNAIKKLSNYKQRGKATIRKITSLLGTDGAINYQTLGANIKSIGELDRKKIGKKGLPKNTIFTKTVNGVKEHFITTRKFMKDYDDSMWILDTAGNLKLNPAIRRIDKNVSFIGDMPTLYTQVEVRKNGKKIRLYRPAQPDEDGVLINVQRPTRVNDVSQDKIVNSNIDAIAYDVDGVVHYELIDEFNQTIMPSKLKERSIDNKSLEYVKPIAVSKEEKKAILEQLIEGSDAYSHLTRANSFALPVIGMIADIMSSDEDDPFTPKWTILSLLATGGYYKLKPHMGGKVKSVSDKLWNKNLARDIEADQARKEIDEDLLGLNVADPFSESARASTRELLQSTINLAKTMRSSIQTALMRNRGVRSMFTELKSLGIDRVNEFQKALMGINTTVNEIFANPARRFTNTMYESRLAKRTKELQEQHGWTEARAEKEARKGVDVSMDIYTEFNEKLGPEIAKPILVELNRGIGKMTDAYIKNAFDDSISRIMDTGAKIPRHLDGKIDNLTVKDVYDGPMGDAFRELDKRMLQNEDIQMWVNAHRSWFNQVDSRYLANLGNQLARTVRLMEDSKGITAEEIAVTQRYIDSGKTINLFEKGLDSASYKALQNVRGSVYWKDLHYIAERYRKHTDELSGKYLPQFKSEYKIGKEKEKFIKDPENNLQGASANEINEAWEREMVGRWIRVNADDEKLAQLKSPNETTGELDTKYYQKKDKAQGELDKMAREIEKENPEIARRILKESKITPVKVQVGKGQRSYYTVNLPKDIALDPRYNTTHYNQLFKHYKAFLKKLDAPESNFLEKPRVKHTPAEFRETNMETIRHRYSNDVGRRIHNMENRMYTAEEVDKYYMKPIVRSLKEKGYDTKKEIPEKEAYLKNVYNIMQGQVGDTAATANQMRRRRISSNIIRNLKMIQYGYGFGPYNMFEWAAIGSHVSSFNQVGKAFKNYSINGVGNRNMEQFLEAENIFKKQIEYARPEFERFGIYDYDPTDAWATGDYYTARLANGVANFSLGGSIINMMGKDADKFYHGVGPARLLPIVGDSFLGSSMYASSMVARASLGEISHLAKIGKELAETSFEDGAVRSIRKGTMTYTEPILRRKFEDLGIYGDDFDRMINGQNRFEELIKKMDEDPTFGAKMDEYTNSKEFGEYSRLMRDVVRHSVESYQGTQKMYRPPAWDSWYGRMLSMYSTYPFNVAVQTTQRRIFQPMKSWVENYASDQAAWEKSMTALEVFGRITTGKTDALLESGMTREAIEAFPVDAFHNILKAGGSFGVSVIGYAGIDFVKDMLGIMGETIGLYEQDQDFRRTKVFSPHPEGYLNPFAPEAQRIQWKDIFDDEFNMQEFSALVTYTQGSAARVGFFGRWGDLQNAANFGGIMELTPVTSTANGLFMNIFGTNNQGLGYYDNSMGKIISKEALKSVPIIGSSVFSEFRRGLDAQLDKYFEKEKKNETRVSF